MKGFQVGILIFFGLFVFIGVLIFSGAIKLGGGGNGTNQATISGVTIWGTVPAKNLRPAIDYLNNKNPVFKIQYVEKDPRTYESDLLNAYAFGGLPDIFLMPQNLIFTYADKVINIPYTYFPERTYDDTYVRSANIFKTPTGFLGFPLFSDPLVMYYNQDILENAGYATPPKYWSDLFEYVPKLTIKNDAQQILKSGVALGEFSNIANAKDIFASLVLQLDNSIVALGPTQKYQSILNSQSTVSVHPTVQSLKFYNEFSDPIKSVYSWNKTMPDSENMFIAGDLAIYFGLASEFAGIKAKNPNLNFDVATLPQVKELNNAITYADVYALAIPKTSPNAQAALSIGADLANGANTWLLIAPSGFAPVRRDLLSQPNLTKYNQVFYTAALNSRSWVDPNDAETEKLFSQMIEDVSSGLASLEDAVTKANNGLKLLLQK
jgi:ABC-type glycerol-3-phosphate transport system substrate-binding protein